MASPALSCSIDALSGSQIALSEDDFDEQSSMWVPEDDQPPADPPAVAEDRNCSDLPDDFLQPLVSPVADAQPSLPPFPTASTRPDQPKATPETRQFWKSGDFTGSFEGASFATEGIDHARVHPKFLHSNATSHKWVLGAIAELLDNAVDEIRNGATFIKIDVMPNPRNGEPMLVIEDDGGGMDPDCMRRCMSLGYSAKSKISGTIGQYGNGFKTSTMRLGADVIVFSRNHRGKPSESIGMMSYTFLTSTGQNDVVIPIVDFQIEAFGIRKLIRSSVDDWMESMQAIQDWSPYASQAEIVSQFKNMPRRQGTKVIIYNLWEDEVGRLELDFDADADDIQIRATTRDEKNLRVAARFPSCRHYLTHKHSLRSYISILYLRLPARFKIFLRGTEVAHHSLRDEMMLVEQVTYRPKDSGHSKAVVTIGFVKDAKEHIDISGFNVYHKNRLIKPFWRIWNPSDTRGRGIIAILEANFVEPAHDKQGFERTIVLARLEARLIEMQKSYWNKHCHMIGYTNATLRKRIKPLSRDSNLPAKNGSRQPAPNDVVKATAHSDSEQVGDKRTSNGANNRANGFSEELGGPSTVMVPKGPEMSRNSSMIEADQRNLVPIAMAPGLDHSPQIEKIASQRQEHIEVAPSLVCSSQERIALCKPLNLSHLNSQESHTSCITGLAPVVIDLDPPDVDKNCGEMDIGRPFPHNVHPQSLTGPEDMQLGSTEAGNACGNSMVDSVAAGLPVKCEDLELFDASVSISPPQQKASPEINDLKDLGREDSIGENRVESRTEQQHINVVTESNNLFIDENQGCPAAPTVVVEEGKEVELGRLERCVAPPKPLAKESKQVELETDEKAMLENGACSAAYNPINIEATSLFDSLEESSKKLPSINNKEVFSLPFTSDIQMILEGHKQNEASESTSISPANVQDSRKIASDFRDEDGLPDQEGNDIMKRGADDQIVLHKTVLTSLPPKSAINASTDMDFMNNVKIAECDEQHDAITDPEKTDFLLAVVHKGNTDFCDQNDSSMSVVEQHEGDNVAMTNIYDKKELGTDAVEQHEREKKAIVLYNGACLHDEMNSQGGAKASCLDIVSISMMPAANVVTGSIDNTSGRDLLTEERVMVVRQKIDYLQISINAVAEEVDDLKEQLHQERELQQLESRNLNTELERAILCLKALSG